MEKTFQKPPVIQMTTDYKKFKKLKGNRQVNTYFLTVLAKSYAGKNLAPFRPVLVNEKWEIIDGQHTFEFNVANKYPIYYIICEGATIDDVRRLNTAQRSWGMQNYLESYAGEGNQNYIKVANYVKEYKLSPSSIVAIFWSKGQYFGMSKVFKSGAFEITPDGEAFGLLLLETIERLKDYIPSRVRSDREFILALRSTLQKVGQKRFIESVLRYNKVVQHYGGIREYLRSFEEIINHGVRTNFTRLI